MYSMIRTAAHRCLVILVAAAFTPGALLAAEREFYVGAALSEPSTDYDWRTDPVNVGSVKDDSGFKVVGGVQLLEPLAIELEYVDFGRSVAPLLVVCIPPIGEPCPAQTLSVDARAISVSAVGLLEVGPLDLFGRAGLSRWQLHQRGSIGTDGRESGTDFSAGLGLQFRFQDIALRLEYEQFDLSGSSTDLISVGFTYTFR